MVKYSLDHLTQDDRQYVFGPIQDDEALFLFALIKVMGIKRVLELGSLSGYSGRNFCWAVGAKGKVYSVDVSTETPKCGDNHVVHHRLDAKDILPLHIDNEPIDLIFFDCHDFDASMAAYKSLSNANLIHPRTVLAFHDTNLHPENMEPHRGSDNIVWKDEVRIGHIHQVPERRLVNEFKQLGYDAICLDTDIKQHNQDFPMRHGITIMKRFYTLQV